MTSLSSITTISSISIILAYGIYTFITSVIKSKDSVKDAERINRYMIFTSGVFIALSTETISSLQSGFFSIEVLFGILLLLLGFALIWLGKFHLANSLYRPLESLSENSANFSKSLMYTRLPEVGSTELRAFSRRFNENVLNLIRSLSNTEINMDKLRRTVNNSSEIYRNISTELYQLTGMVHRSQNIFGEYNNTFNNLESSSQGLIEWYDNSKEEIQSILHELRALTDVGNLIAVNASIESINMEVEHPGISTIADKLHDLAKELEEKHNILNKFLREMQKHFANYNHNITDVINEAKMVIQKGEHVFSDLESSIVNITAYDRSFLSENDKMKMQAENAISELPQTPNF